jgi:hypothetical protein
MKCIEITTAMRQRIGKDLPPFVPTIAAPIVEEGMSRAGPYVRYWPLNAAFEDAQWFRVVKNHHLVVTTIGFHFQLEFNDIIKGL